MSITPQDSKAWQAGRDWAAGHAFMPSDTETDDACASWYGSNPVPKTIAAAWHAGRTDSQRPIPKDYLTVSKTVVFTIQLEA